MNLTPEVLDLDENVKMDISRKWTALVTEVEEEVEARIAARV